MIKKINRYIICELLQTFFFSLIAMTALLIIVGLVREALDKNVPITHVLRLVPFVTIEMSRISIPMTFLLAVTTFFAKMSGNNEVIALKALGVPPIKFLYPVMVLGVLVSLASVWLNELAVTWGRTGMASVIYSAAEDIILNQLKKNHSFSTDSGDLTIMVKGVEDRKLVSPTITSKSTQTTVEAKSAQLKIDFVTQELTVSMQNVKLDAKGGSYITDDRTITLPLAQIIKPIETTSKRASDMGLAEIPVEINEKQMEIAKILRHVAAQKAFAACTGNVQVWASQPIIEQKRQIEDLRESIDRLNVEPPRRWSSGFSCFFFIWLGVPLAIWMKKSDVFSSFFACFVPILLLYYPLFMLGLQGAKNGTMPPSAVWIANLCLGIIGFWFLSRVNRY